MFRNITDGYGFASSGTATAGTTQTQAGATALTKGVNQVTTGNANDGVALPKAGPDNNYVGRSVIVENVSANALKVYPYYDSVAGASGGTVNGGSANAAFSQSASTTYLYVCTAPDTWRAHKLS